MSRRLRATPLALALVLGVSACAYGPKTVVGEPPAPLASRVVPLPITYNSFRNDGATIDTFAIDCSNNISKVSVLADRCDKDSSDEFQILRGGAVTWSVTCSAKLDPDRKPAAHLVCTYDPKDASAGAMTLALAASSTAALSGMYVGDAAWFVEPGASAHEKAPWAVAKGEPKFVVRRASGEPVLSLGAKSDHGVGRTTAFMAPGLTDEERAELIPLIFTLMQMYDPRQATSSLPADREPDGSLFRLDIIDGKLTLRAPDTIQLSEGECEYTESEATPLPFEKPNMNVHAQHALQILRAGRTEAARALWYVLEDD